LSFTHNGLFLAAARFSDEFALPLCRVHRRLVHRMGNETAWWQEASIDPLKAARKLWEPKGGMPAGRAQPRAEFIDENGGGPGVRLRKRSPEKSRK
jgi:hypothetical protein